MFWRDLSFPYHCPTMPNFNQLVLFVPLQYIMWHKLSHMLKDNNFDKSNFTNRLNLELRLKWLYLGRGLNLRYTRGLEYISDNFNSNELKISIPTDIELPNFQSEPVLLVNLTHIAKSWKIFPKNWVFYGVSIKKSSMGSNYMSAMNSVITYKIWCNLELNSFRINRNEIEMTSSRIGVWSE